MESESVIKQGSVLGIDLGTSGVRVAALALDGTEIGNSACHYTELGEDHRSPELWWEATCRAVDSVLNTIERSGVVAICIDGTSGTLLPVDNEGVPLASPLMYNDAVSDESTIKLIAEHMPVESAAGGVTSGLAKAIQFSSLKPHLIVHQADWIAAKFTGNYNSSDANNALKTGYDPVAGTWPDWIEKTGFNTSLLPEVHVPGTNIGIVSSKIATRFDLNSDTQLFAGTTDGCASFLATGASQPGESVTALGSTITLKILSDKPLFAPEYGLYSHRIGDMWLSGGASNSGGRVLAHFYNTAELHALSDRIDTEYSSSLGYYPLLSPGERFPINDADLQPKLSPRPDNDVHFLHGLLQGMTTIEAMGYKRLAEIGAPELRSVRTVGGGAVNKAWTRLRERELGVEFLPAASEQAAVGAARLALHGLHSA